MRCFLLTESFLQSFTHRRKNAAAPCAERPLRQNPTMRNIAPIAERKSQESRRRKGCEKREALLRNRGWKCSIYSCLLGAFQLMVGIHIPKSLKMRFNCVTRGKISRENGRGSHELVAAASAVFLCLKFRYSFTSLYIVSGIYHAATRSCQIITIQPINPPAMILTANIPTVAVKSWFIGTSHRNILLIPKGTPQNSHT